MAVKIEDRGEAPGHPGRSSVTPEIWTEATILISELSLNRMRGDTSTIKSLKYCRLDRQPPPSGGANIQVQLNGLSGDSTIATCVIHQSVLDSMATWPSRLLTHQNGWLTRQVRIALTNSLETCNIFYISGSFYDTDNPKNLTPRKENNYQNRRVEPVIKKYRY